MIINASRATAIKPPMLLKACAPTRKPPMRNARAIALASRVIAKNRRINARLRPRTMLIAMSMPIVLRITVAKLAMPPRENALLSRWVTMKTAKLVPIAPNAFRVIAMDRFVPINPSLPKLASAQTLRNVKTTRFAAKISNASTKLAKKVAMAIHAQTIQNVQKA